MAGAHSDIEYTVVNLLRGVFVRTELNMLSRGPQLARADAGTSWQIADARRWATPKAVELEDGCPWCTSVGDLRVRFVVEPLLADPPTVRFSTTGANMVSRTKRRQRARDPLSVPGLPALVTQSTCWLRSASASDTQLAQHPCSSTAVRATAGCSAAEPQTVRLSSQIVRAACAQPAAQSPGDG